MRRLTLLIIACFGLLSGCGSSSSSDANSYTSSYIQFYNGSANSAATRLTLTNSDDATSYIGSATYADSTSLIIMSTGSYGYILNRYNSVGDAVSVYESSIALRQSYKHLLLLLGDYNTPDLLEFSFLRDDELSTEFNLYVVNALDDAKTYDLYIGDIDTDFNDAKLVSTLGYRQISSKQTYTLGRYHIYITEAGSNEVLFKSPLFNFEYYTDYVLIPRIASGQLEGVVAVDVISNSTTVTNLTDELAEAQVRVYNSIDSTGSANVFVNNNLVLAGLAPDTLSDFVRFNAADYRLSATDDNNNFFVNNALLTLNQGNSKTAIFYHGQNGESLTAVLTDSNLPQIYDFKINILNTVMDYTSLGIYFVRSTETISSSQYYISALARGGNSSLTIPDNSYQILLVHTDSNGNRSLLAQTDITEFVNGRNYTLVAEPDSSSFSGYKLSLIY